MPTRPRSRKPDSWPPAVVDLITLAIDNEVLVPFESQEKLTAFKRTINAIRRSYREWGHPRSAEIDALRSLDVRTIDIQRERPSYTADAAHFPWTVCLSPAVGFLTNLNSAVSIRHPDGPPAAPPVPTDLMRLEDELTAIVSEQLVANDSDELVEFFKSRRKND